MSAPTLWAYALEMQAHTGAEVVNINITNAPALMSIYDPNVTWESNLYWELAGIPAWVGGLIQPGNYEIACFASGKSFGKASMGYGVITLDNNAGQFDYMMDYAFDGRPATLRRIDANLMDSATYPGDWTTIYTGTLGMPTPSVTGYNQGTITLPWRDRMAELQTPIPLEVYRGDNALPLGLEGTVSDLANKVKPLVLGQVYEIAPECCNTAKLIYAVSPPILGAQDLIADWDAITNFDAITDFFGSVINGISSVTVYDSGLLITQGANYTDESDMMTNAPTAGQCRVLPDRGYVRFGSQPAGIVTVSCTGYRVSPALIGGITRMLLNDYMKWDDSRINLTELTAIDAACTIPVGTIVRSAANMDSILDELFASAGACYYFDQYGVFRSFRVSEPSGMTPSFSLSGLQIMGLTRENNDGIPAKLIRVRQQKCWTVQKSGIAGATTAERRAWIANEYRENISTNSVTATKHLLSKDLEFNTAFSADAQSETDRRRDIYSVQRDFFKVKIVPSLFDFSSLRLGMCCSLGFNGRFGYTNKNMLLIGISADLANDNISLSFWG